jgi:ubiquinone/menaquinone biosynthesis C-methylase UbiE
MAHDATSSAGQEELDEREVARHLLLFHQLSQALGGPVPTERLDLARISSVLDVACGAGGWTLDLACAYPRLQVTGIDASARCITSAQRLAKEGGFSNVRFLVQDPGALQEVESQLPGAPFDLIHVAFLAPALLRMDYPTLLRTLLWLCSPGGMVYWTEMEFPITNSPAFERLTALTCNALAASGHTFVPPSMQALAAFFHSERPGTRETLPRVERRHLGITPMLGNWFHQVGYRQIQQVPIAIEVSSGTEAHPCFTLQVEAFVQQITPFLLAQGVLTEEACEQLCVQVKAEVQQDTFCGLCSLLSVLGQAPSAGNAAPL